MLLIVHIALLMTLQVAWGIRCHQCISRNGDNRDCEVPSPFGAQECFATSRDTLQPRMEPGRFCISLRTASRTRLGEQVLIRTCSSSRPPDCGVIQFGNENFSGCSLICSYDSCNSVEPPQSPVYSNDFNRMPGQNYNEMGGTTTRLSERSDARTGNRSIMSFGKILVALLMMRNERNKP